MPIPIPNQTTIHTTNTGKELTHVTHVRFRRIWRHNKDLTVQRCSPEHVDLPISDAADFFLENYPTHFAEKFKFRGQCEYTDCISVRWRTDARHRVVEVNFYDISKHLWASTKIALPRMLGVKA